MSETQLTKDHSLLRIIIHLKNVLLALVLYLDPDVLMIHSNYIAFNFKLQQQQLVLKVYCQHKAFHIALVNFYVNSFDGR